MTVLVPRGAEHRAVARALGPAARAIPAGRAAAQGLPAALAGPVVVAGICGALRRFRVGDAVVYGTVDAGDGARALDPAFARSLAAHLGAPLACALDVPRVVTTARERARLSAARDADVVDMECGALERALGARGIPYATVRIISDDPDRDLPPIEDAITADGGVDGARVALAFARAPAAAAAFLSDLRRATAALRTTAERLRSWRP